MAAQASAGRGTCGGWTRAFLPALALMAGVALAQPTGTEGAPMQDAFGPLIGGCGGVYFLAEPGELWVEVMKRDTNARDAKTVLRALLAGPDRQVLQEQSIPDDDRPRGSGLGPAAAVRLSTNVARRGVYVLNITVSNDRYGTEMRWAFRSNCPRYVIETARGHRDERHQEPIVLANPDQPGDVCFLPRKGALSMEVTGLDPKAGPLQMLDAAGTLLATLPVDTKGATSHTFAAASERGPVPWRLHLPSAQGTLHVDGLTRWERGDANPDMCCWSPDLAAWFPLLENRWILTPYCRTAYARAGEDAEVSLQVRNDADHPREISLRVEHDGAAWPIELTPQRVTLRPGSSAPVTVRFTGAEGVRTCHVVAQPVDDPAFSTYSTVTVKPGEAPAEKPLTMPVLLRPYSHENDQFGYLPRYPVDNQLYFDAQNRPCTQVPGGVAVLRDGRWTSSALSAAVTSRTPSFEGEGFSLLSTKIAFDADGDMYLLARCGATSALLHSADGGQTFAAYAIPGSGGSFDLEQFSGQNIPGGPPSFVRLIRTASDANLRWRSLNNLELFAPVKRDGRIDIGAPQLITRQCIGFSGHSGMPNSLVSRGDRIHVAWGEATDPAVSVPGVPTYVATYNRTTGELSKPVLIGYGPPANDGHNTPSITMDSDGYLHVLVGTHGRPFQYAQSLQPNDSAAGFTEAKVAAEGHNQTYIGFVCGKDNTLYTVFRLWRTGEPHPDASFATLAFQRKRPGQPWEAPRILVVAPFSEYSIFYHRLTIDREGRLFLSYDYWSTYWFYRNDLPVRQRTVLMSPDGGDTWKLASESDLN
jgi:hypothetical protein